MGHRRLGLPVALVIAALPLGWPARAADDALLCRAAIAATEHATGIPDAFLSAIGRVESGRPISGHTIPWPWTINAAGTGHFYASKQEAISAARGFLAAGIRSIDVGCLQVNLMFHPDAFASLDQALDPSENTAYAARLLRNLFDREGSWPRAAAAYHSQTPANGASYQQKVLDAWAIPDRDPAEPPRAPESKPPRAAISAAAPAPRIPAAALPPPRMTERFTLPAPNLSGQGRTLSAYRAMPVLLAARAPHPADMMTRR